MQDVSQDPDGRWSSDDDCVASEGVESGGYGQLGWEYEVLGLDLLMGTFLSNA